MWRICHMWEGLVFRLPALLALTFWDPFLSKSTTSKGKSHSVLFKPLPNPPRWTLPLGCQSFRWASTTPNLECSLTQAPTISCSITRSSKFPTTGNCSGPRYGETQLAVWYRRAKQCSGARHLVPAETIVRCISSMYRSTTRCQESTAYCRLWHLGSVRSGSTSIATLSLGRDDKQVRVDFRESNFRPSRNLGNVNETMWMI